MTCAVQDVYFRIHRAHLALHAQPQGSIYLHTLLTVGRAHRCRLHGFLPGGNTSRSSSRSDQSIYHASICPGRSKHTYLRGVVCATRRQVTVDDEHSVRAQMVRLIYGAVLRPCRKRLPFSVAPAIWTPSLSSPPPIPNQSVAVAVIVTFFVFDIPVSLPTSREGGYLNLASRRGKLCTLEVVVLRGAIVNRTKYC